MRMRAPGALLATVLAAALSTGPPVPAYAQSAEGSSVAAGGTSAGGSLVAGDGRAVEGRVLGVGLPGAIPGRYIVTLTDGTIGAASLRGGRVLARSGNVLAMALTAAAARQLAADPAVRLVEQDRVIRLAATQQNPAWGLDRIDQRAAKRSRTYTPMDDGDTVHAYVIDTGIRIRHAEFGGRASYGYDFADLDRSASDCNGHGTHVAGTIGGAHYGVAKRVRLVAVRVLNCAGEGTVFDVIRGVDWVTAHAVRPAVANMSLGGSRSAALDAAVRRSIAAGVTYAVAAGNDDVNAARESPAAVTAAITVGATDSADRRASFSNYGKVLDLFAPGVNIRSAVSDSNTATGVYSGTSMAAPHVAGAAALVLDAFPTYRPAQVRDYLVAHATTGRVTDPAGAPRRLLFVPAPPTAPVIVTSMITAPVSIAYAGRLVLNTARRGRWSVTSGSLPAGLHLSSAGVISGTPTVAGVSTMTVRFVDFVPNIVTQTVTVTVTEPAPTITAMFTRASSWL